ncbi:unnamed protein product [Amoebophrya sp. A25]|nr:unnamed protein product [Amoebophrya sp. A25]CAD7962453.1 unnamed protein product [Amoebophrya sp. A25]|eukprot:GSA25T00019048001.1
MDNMASPKKIHVVVRNALTGDVLSPVASDDDNHDETAGARRFGGEDVEEHSFVPFFCTFKPRTMCVRDFKRLLAKKLTSLLRQEAQPGAAVDTIQHENVILVKEHPQEENSKSTKDSEGEEDVEAEDAAMTMEAEGNSETDIASDPSAEDVKIFIEDRYAYQASSEDVSEENKHEQNGGRGLKENRKHLERTISIAYAVRTYKPFESKTALQIAIACYAYASLCLSDLDELIFNRLRRYPFLDVQELDELRLRLQPHAAHAWRSVILANYGPVRIWNLSQVEDLTYLFQKVDDPLTYQRLRDKASAEQREAHKAWLVYAQGDYDDLTAWRLDAILGTFKEAFAREDIAAWNVTGVKNLDGMFHGFANFDADLVKAPANSHLWLHPCKEF